MSNCVGDTANPNWPRNGDKLVGWDVGDESGDGFYSLTSAGGWADEPEPSMLGDLTPGKLRSVGQPK